MQNFHLYLRGLLLYVAIPQDFKLWIYTSTKAPITILDF